MQIPEAFHLKARKRVSNAILESRYMNSFKGELMVEGKQGYWSEEIHDRGDYGVLGIDFGHKGPVLAIQRMGMLTGLKESPKGTCWVSGLVGVAVNQ